MCLFHLRSVFLLCVVLVLGCAQQPSTTTVAVPHKAPIDLPTAIEKQLDQPDSIGLQPSRVAQIRAFYQARAFGPVWHDTAGARLNVRARQLRQALSDSEKHGLEPAKYLHHELLRLCDSHALDDQAQVELLLTDAYIRYAHDLYEGQTRPEQVDPDWHIQAPRLDALDYLQQALQQDDFAAALARLAPPHRGYRQLLTALVRYRQLATLGGWPFIDHGPLLRKGDRSLRIETLRMRLWLEGYLVELSVADPYYFDDELEQAVQQFQRLHTLAIDGMVGGDTLAALNVPVETRINQILLNLERWRWLPRELQHRYLLVNMAGFELKAYDEGQPVLSMKVIVGKPFLSTPAFSGGLGHVVINPYWNVPQKITEEELVPAQVADPNYLTQHHIRVLQGWQPDAAEIDPTDLDWKKYLNQHFPYRLRQDPGPTNSLGRIKFMLSNPFSIYMHDTPSRHLFERPARTFSHGCIRLEKPLALAQFLFDGAENWDVQQLQEWIDSGETRTEYLPGGAIPVYLVYLTAWVDDGSSQQLHFADDIYARDSKLASKLSALQSENSAN